MAKKQSFADKASKKKDVRTCPVCNQPIEPILYVKAEKNEGGSAYRYRYRHIGLCKCTEKEVLS